jgi:hypothetical protein
VFHAADFEKSDAGVNPLSVGVDDVSSLLEIPLVEFPLEKMMKLMDNKDQIIS